MAAVAARSDCPGGKPILQVRNLSIGFANSSAATDVVRDVSLDVRPGEVLGLVGESGSGKSLLCKAVLRVLPRGARITGGEIAYRGQDLATAKAKDLQRVRGQGISLVLQDPMSALNPVLKIGRQIAEPMLVHRLADRKQAYEKVVTLLEQVSIKQPADRIQSYPHQLSGGMRQRVNAAVALSCDPEILIADEPTTALDATVQMEFLGLLDRIRRERGLAVLLVTHDFGVVAQSCDRVAVMYKGELVEHGSVDQIFDAPRHDYTRSLLAAAAPSGETAQ